MAKTTSFVDRLAARFGFSRMIEAVNHRSEERGWVYAQAQDSKVDLSSYDRTRLMALSRKCFYNNAIVRGAVRDKAMYSVGSGIGIRPQAMSGDQAWDDAAEQWWENWARSPEISGRHDMRSLQMLVSEAIDRDGEIFAILTAKTDGAPAVQIVEAHRVESPDTSASNNGVVDGVKLDKFQRPLGYFIGEGDEYPRRHREVKADAMLHVYEPERADQVRGYPAIGVALNSVLDRDELLRFEMMAAKAGSSIGLVIKNSTGNIGAEGFLGDFSKDSNGNLTRESIFGGGLVPRMKNTEDIQSFVMNRPNEKLDKHLEQYIRAAAIGLGLPYEFVWDTSAIGGVAQRFIIQKAARCFAARQDVLVNAFLSKLWRYAIARAISRKELPMNPGWQSVGWQTPRSITVDVGREATARRDDVKAGLMTLSDYFGEQGIDWKEAVAEIATEREFAADLGVMIGVEQAQPQDQIFPAAVEPEVVMPAAEFSQLISKLDCGTGAGGFKPGNDCAKGSSVDSEEENPVGGAEQLRDTMISVSGDKLPPVDGSGLELVKIKNLKFSKKSDSMYFDVEMQPTRETAEKWAESGKFDEWSEREGFYVEEPDFDENYNGRVSVSVRVSDHMTPGSAGSNAVDVAVGRKYWEGMKNVGSTAGLYKRTPANELRDGLSWIPDWKEAPDASMELVGAVIGVPLPKISKKFCSDLKSTEFSVRARKKKRIYRRNKPEDRPTA
jgi:lambda family phage portal protein